MVHSIWVVIFLAVVYGLAASAGSAQETLIDDSEYQNLIAFDAMLTELQSSLHNHTKDSTHILSGAKTSTTYSPTLNYANIAMMYHQRNQRWKQGGNVESLKHTNLALEAQKYPFDDAHNDRKLRRSMLLHKALMSASLGRRQSALQNLNQLIALRHTSKSPAFLEKIFDLLPESKPMSNQELSNLLYHKAELYQCHRRDW